MIIVETEDDRICHEFYGRTPFAMGNLIEGTRAERGSLDDITGIAIVIGDVSRPSVQVGNDRSIRGRAIIELAVGELVIDGIGSNAVGCEGRSTTFKEEDGSGIAVFGMQHRCTPLVSGNGIGIGCAVSGGSGHIDGIGASRNLVERPSGRERAQQLGLEVVG